MLLFTTRTSLIFLLPVVMLAAASTLLVADDIAAWQKRQQQINKTTKKIQPSVVAVGGGSGVIVSADGHVLTASHVTGVAGRRMQVKLSDGRVAMATTLGSNPNTDTGALKLDGSGPWPFVPFQQQHDEPPVEEGQWVLTFGYPLSFPRGKPAAVRLGRITSVADDQLLADSPIMGGDSGGPLVDLSGRLIGINSRVKTDIETNIFVPIKMFRDDWASIENRLVVATPADAAARPWLGIFGDTDQTRVRIRKVQPNSPADKVGMMAGDVIEKLNGESVDSFTDVIQTLKSLRPDDLLVVEINRFGQSVKLSIKLGTRP